MASLMCALLVCSIGAAFAKEPSTNPAAPDGTTATCFLEIRWSGAFEPDLTRLSQWLRQGSVEGLAKDLGVPAQAVSFKAGVAHSQTGATVELRVTLSDRSKATDLKKAMESLIGRVNDDVQRSSERRLMDRMEGALKAEAVARITLKDQAKEIQDFEAHLRKENELSSVSADGVERALEKWEDERRSLEVDQRGLLDRLDSLKMLIAEQAKRQELIAKDDALAGELAKLVAARTKELDRVRAAAAQGTAADSEILKAETALAEATARLLQRRIDAAAATGGEMVGVLNKEMTMLTLDLRTKEARLFATKSQLNHMSVLPPLLSELQQMRDVQSQLRHEWEAAAARVRELQSLDGSVSTVVSKLIFDEQERQGFGQSQP